MLEFICFISYNNKSVYCTERNKWVTQKIHVISNVELSIPYEKFVSLSQFLTVAETTREKDFENDTLTITYFLGDFFNDKI